MMRKFLMALTLAAGALLAVPAAQAAPAAMRLAPVAELDSAAAVQPVQYYDYRYRQARREEYERWRYRQARREARREFRYNNGYYGRPYGGPRYGYNRY